MVTAEMYKNYLSSYGSNLAQVKKNQSDAIMNNSFTADAQYKRVYKSGSNPSVSVCGRER